MTSFAWLRAPRDRADLRRHIQAAAAASVRPEPGDRFRLYDANPMRVLIIGSGIAVGFGVTRRDQALDGQLGLRLADALRRGVVVNNQADHGTRLEDQLVTDAVALGSGLADLVVWCPSYVEMGERITAGAWQRRLSRLLTLSPAAPIVVLELPTPVGPERAAATAAPRIARINARIRRAAAEHPLVVVAEPPTVLIKPHGTPLFDAGYYARLGAVVADAALPLLATRTPALR